MMWTKEERKIYNKLYRETHKEQRKAWDETHKEQIRAYQKVHKKQIRARQKSDINSLGQIKYNIRSKSSHYLSKYGKKIEGYQIHHCCSYSEPYKFIYCTKEMHLKIHQFLRDNNINSDSDHYEQIKHLLDDTVVKYGID